MAKLPIVKPKQVIKALQRAGFYIARQKGSHICLRHPDKPGGVTVPMHGTDMKRGMLKGILEQAGLTVGEFLELL